MKVKDTLEVSAEEYFDYISSALFKELKRMGIKGLKKADVKAGYKFVKKYKHGHQTFDVDCTIEEMEFPKRYKISMKTPSSVQTIAHTITELDEQRIQLVYEEDIESNSFMVKLRKFTKGGQAKKGMYRTLEILETAIIERRKK